MEISEQRPLRYVDFYTTSFLSAGSAVKRYAILESTPAFLAQLPCEERTNEDILEMTSLTRGLLKNAKRRDVSRQDDSFDFFEKILSTVMSGALAGGVWRSIPSSWWKHRQHTIVNLTEEIIRQNGGSAHIFLVYDQLRAGEKRIHYPIVCETLWNVSGRKRFTSLGQGRYKVEYPSAPLEHYAAEVLFEAGGGPMDFSTICYKINRKGKRPGREHVRHELLSHTETFKKIGGKYMLIAFEIGAEDRI